MFDFLRNLGKSAEEKRLEQLNAYLDGELAPAEAERFEAALKQDPALRAELGQLQQIKGSLAELPRLRAPRNYTLDPAVYGAPAPQPSQWLPAVRVATALAAFLFVVVVALDVLTLGGQQPLVSMSGQEAEVADVVQEEIAVEGEAVAVTRVVTDEIETQEEAAEMAPPPPGETAEAFAIEEEAEEEAAAEEAVIEEETAEMPAEEPEAMEEAADAGVAADSEPAGGGPTPFPSATADAASARAMDENEMAEAEIRATEVTNGRAPEPADQDGAQEAEETPVVSERGFLSPLRIAQIVLGLLLAGLLIAWALVRRE